MARSQIWWRRLSSCRFVMSEVLSANPFTQGCCQLFHHLRFVGAALRYSHLAAGLYQETAPVLLSIDVQHHVIFNPIKCDLGGLGSEHSAAMVHRQNQKASIVTRFVRRAEQGLDLCVFHRVVGLTLWLWPKTLPTTTTPEP